MKKYILFILVFCFIVLGSSFIDVIGDTNNKNYVGGFYIWLTDNSDQKHRLPYSHVGDSRFKKWTITYDSAVVSLAYTALGNIENAKKIMDFYADNETVRRLGGIIEAVNTTYDPPAGIEWSVRTGSNLWLGIASFHLYLVTSENKYLEFTKRQADFTLSLQNLDKNSPNFGAIRLGPEGAPSNVKDQKIYWDENNPVFFNIYSTEHNIDAWALFNMLYAKTKDEKYKTAKGQIFNWLRSIAYNPDEHRFNRGFYKNIDATVASDVFFWGISALGVEELNKVERNLADKMIDFAEKNCRVEISYKKNNGEVIQIQGFDFISQSTETAQGRGPVISPEWTFQAINAYAILNEYYQNKNKRKANKFKEKRDEFLQSMLKLAEENNSGLAFPYATKPDVSIGHEYNTPKEGNLSAIGAAYGILALLNYDPLNYDKTKAYLTNKNHKDFSKTLSSEK